MKILVDAVGCTFGGIATYEENLLQWWTLDFPSDELLVLRSTPDRGCPVPPTERIRVGRPEVVARPLAVTRSIRALERTWRPDALLALQPATSLLKSGAPLAVVVHDLRHEVRPSQFSRFRRAVRWASYGRSYAIADGLICISHRTYADLLHFHPALGERASAVIYHGADHVDRWVPDGAGHVVAFGHHSNKNVDLVLEAWGLLARSGTLGAATPLLNVVGLSAERRRELTRSINQLCLDKHVVLSEYLNDDAFHARMAGASAVAYPSDFEGFGLPVIESMRLGAPVVIGPDPALVEVANGHGFLARDWSASSVADAVRRALGASEGELAAARHHAASFTWSRTVHETRAFLERLIHHNR